MWRLQWRWLRPVQRIASPDPRYAAKVRYLRRLRRQARTQAIHLYYADEMDYVIFLAPDERVFLLSLTQNGHAAAKQLTHARILLKADYTPADGGWSDEVIHAALDVSIATIERVRLTYVTQGLDAVLRRKARRRNAVVNWMVSAKHT